MDIGSREFGIGAGETCWPGVLGDDVGDGVEVSDLFLLLDGVSLVYWGFVL